MQQRIEDDVDTLYERVKPKLRAMASRFVGWDDAEDVVQDAFLKALTFPGVFRHEASLATWMTRILMNVAIDETRRRKRRPSCLASSSIERAERAMHPIQLVRLEMKAALADSTRMDREVLVLAGVMGFSHEETAHRLGLSVGTTKSRLWHARRRLRNRVSVKRLDE